MLPGTALSSRSCDCGDLGLLSQSCTKVFATEPTLGYIVFNISVVFLDSNLTLNCGLNQNIWEDINLLLYFSILCKDISSYHTVLTSFHVWCVRVGIFMWLGDGDWKDWACMSHRRVNTTKVFLLLQDLVCSFERGREPWMKFDLFCTGKLKTIEFPLFSSVKPIDSPKRNRGEGLCKSYFSTLYDCIFRISCDLQRLLLAQWPLNKQDYDVQKEVK